MSLLTVTGVTAGYGRMQVLHDVDLKVERGQLVTLLGHNGAGKTTLLSSIFGLIKTRSGSVEFDGGRLFDSGRAEPSQSGIALVPQGVGVFSLLTVRENLRLGFWSRKGLGRSDDDFEPALEHFPALRTRLDEPAGKLSGGQRQMVSISRALLNSPKLLLLDEPSVGLAPVLVEQVLKVLRNLANDGLSILLVEQNVRQALSVADYTYVLKSGRVVHEALPGEIDQPERLWELY